MTRIEWTDATWNPVTGCSPVSAGCANCYAAGMARRLAGHPKTAARYAGIIDPQTGHFNGTVLCHDDLLLQPLRWRRPRMVFVCSMSDLLHPDVPDEFIDKMIAIMALTPQHTYHVLTKRPERLAAYLMSRTPIDDSGTYERSPQWYQVVTDMLDAGSAGPLGRQWDRCHSAAASLDLCRPLPNLWLGTSCEDQPAADVRLRHLRRCLAAVRFVSFEPLLGPIRVPMDGLHWVKVGGESGPKARWCEMEYLRDIVHQCKAANVPCFVTQLGTWAADETGYPMRPYRIRDRKCGDPSEWPEDLRVRQWPEVLA